MYLYKNPCINIGFTVLLANKNDLFTWKCALIGPTDTSYSGGLFFLKAYFPDNYPSEPPEICFITPVYHVNINPYAPRYNGDQRLGHVSISTLNWWKPETSMKEVICDIFILFYLGNPDSFYSLEIANEMKNNRYLFEKKVKYFTKKYADPSTGCKNYGKDWDFSYPFK